MRTITLLFSLLCLAFIINAQTNYADFEAAPYGVAQNGATYSLVTNPLQTGINASANCAKVGRSTQTLWYAQMYVLGTSFTLSANSKKYVHIMMKYDAEPRIYIREVFTGNTKNNFSLNKYTKIGEWQDMVFEIRRSGAEADINITGIRVFFDAGTNLSAPSSVPVSNILTDGTKFAYIDEIIINDDPTPRGETLSLTKIHDFESTVPTYIKDIRTFADATNTVQYPVTNPFTSGINTSASCGVRNYIEGTTWWPGFDFFLTKPVIVDNNHRYMHVMIATPADNTDISIDARLLDNIYNSGVNNVVMGDKPYTITTANTWQDVVVDLQTHINATLATAMPVVSSFSIKCGKNAAMQVGNYYFDEIVINGDPNPRTQVITTNTINLSTIQNAASTEMIMAKGDVLIVNETESLKKVTIGSGAQLTNTNGNTLTLETLDIESDTNGNGTLVESGSTTTVTGTTTVKQYLPQGRNWYVGSPIETNIATTGNLTAAGATSVSYYSEKNGWQHGYTGNLAEGLGYVAASSTGTATNKVNFVGQLNSGDVSITLTKKGSSFIGYNLIANPYPSYINPMAAINLNSNLEKTIWYRTRKTVAPYEYKFETVNTTSGVGTNAAGTGMVTGHIPPMQAFWVRTNADEQPFTFTNAMRVHAGNVTVGAETVPTTVLKSKKQDSQSILRLVLSGNAGTDEAVLYVDANASNLYDKFDSRKMFESATSNNPEIYTTVGNEKLVINGLNTIPYDVEIPLGFTAKQTGDYSISRSEMTNFDADTRIVLKDKQYPTSEVELTEGTVYKFTSQSTTLDNSRFVVLFKIPGVSTSIESTTSSNVTVYLNSNKEIVISSNLASNYSVYNALGMLVHSGKTQQNEMTKTIRFSAGVYVVRVNNQSTKIIVN